MNEFPWQAAIVYAGTRQPKCGASVLNDRYILTAVLTNFMMGGNFKLNLAIFLQTHCFWFDGMQGNNIILRSVCWLDICPYQVISSDFKCVFLQPTKLKSSSTLISWT